MAELLLVKGTKGEPFSKQLLGAGKGHQELIINLIKSNSALQGYGEGILYERKQTGGSKWVGAQCSQLCHCVVQSGKMLLHSVTDNRGSL